MSSLPPKPSTSTLPVDLAPEIATSLQIQYKGQRARDLQQTVRPTIGHSFPSVSPAHLTAKATHLAEFKKDLLALGMPPHLLKKYPPSPVLNSGVIKCEWNVPATSVRLSSCACADKLTGISVPCSRSIRSSEDISEGSWLLYCLHIRRRS